MQCPFSGGLLSSRLTPDQLIVSWQVSPKHYELHSSTALPPPYAQSLTQKLPNVSLTTQPLAPRGHRFWTLLDPTYAKKFIPIIASVSEHQPTTWAR